jgi:hypothetical protein
MFIIFGSLQLKMRPINVLWGLIDLGERKKSSCSQRSKFCSFSDRGHIWVTKHCQSII